MNAPSEECNRPSSFDLDGERAERSGLPLSCIQHSWVGECSRRCVAWLHDRPGSHPPAPTVELAPLADDLSRVEETLRGAVRTADPFLADVATHLIEAGGKRIRPTLALCATYASSSATRAQRRRDHRGGRGGAGPPGIALPRRRHRRSRDPAWRAQRQRPLEQHRGDPRRRLPPRTRVVAGGVARCRRRRAPRGDDRRALPGAGPRAPASLRHHPQRGRLRVDDRGQDRRAVRDVVSHRRHGGARVRSHPRRAHPVRAPPRHVLPDRRRRPRPHRERGHARQARRAGSPRGRLHASGDLRARASHRSSATCSGNRSTRSSSPRCAASPPATARSSARSTWHATTR